MTQKYSIMCPKNESQTTLSKPCSKMDDCNFSRDIGATGHFYATILGHFFCSFICTTRMLKCLKRFGILDAFFSSSSFKVLQHQILFLAWSRVTIKDDPRVSAAAQGSCDHWWTMIQYFLSVPFSTGHWYIHCIDFLDAYFPPLLQGFPTSLFCFSHKTDWA